MRRFYAPPAAIENRRVRLDAGETRHLRDVLRLAAGTEVRVFDGKGKEYLCRIEKIDRRETVLEIGGEIAPAATESGLELTLAVALIKGDRFELVIQKAVELGVAGFCPLTTARSEVKLKNARKKLERWQKIAIEATKQCGRAKLMRIAAPQPFEDFVAVAGQASRQPSPSEDGEELLFFAERSGKGFATIRPAQKITAVAGSEGGWEDAEIELAARQNFRIITFGGRILRAETAAISIAAILQHRFGDLN